MAMGTNEQGAVAGGLTGAASGAAIGTMVAPGFGTAIGAGVGLLVGGTVGYMQANAQRLAQKRAINAAETARRMAIIREMGAKQQADDMSLAALNTNKGQSKTPVLPSAGGVIGMNTQNAPTAGANTTSAGTF